MDLYPVAVCYNARQENAITHITQNNIQGNPLYAKLYLKKSRKHIKTHECVEPKEVESVFKSTG
jgi:hypothetical protein